MATCQRERKHNPFHVEFSFGSKVFLLSVVSYFLSEVLSFYIVNEECVFSHGTERLKVKAVNFNQKFVFKG